MRGEGYFPHFLHRDNTDRTSRPKTEGKAQLAAAHEIRFKMSAQRSRAVAHEKKVARLFCKKCNTSDRLVPRPLSPSEDSRGWRESLRTRPPLRSPRPGVYFTTDVTSERHICFREPKRAAQGEHARAHRAIRPDLRMEMGYSFTMNVKKKQSKPAEALYLYLFFGDTHPNGVSDHQKPGSKQNTGVVTQVCS